MENTGNTFDEQGKAAFGEGKYEKASQLFQQAADAYHNENNPLLAAESLNNLSVALVKANRAEEALEAVGGTEKLFEEAGDMKRHAMALGNKAAALEALGKTDEAIELYEMAVKIFHELGEDDLKTFALQAISEINLRKGKLTSTALNAVDALISNPNPTLKQKILKFFFRRFAKL